MDNVEADRQYPEVVAYAVQYLMNLHRDKTAVDAAEIEKAVSVASVLYPAVMDVNRQAWLRRDIAHFVEDFWETLKDKKNRGRVSEIIRGALR